MADIRDILAEMLDTRYGDEMRQLFVDAIMQCYEDGKAGAIDIQAREQLEHTPRLDGTGKVDLQYMPEVALDRLVKVETDADRFALTKDDAQTGDTIKVLATDLMYLVIDDDKLDSEDGYTGYSASVDWDTLTGKPDDLAEAVELTEAEYDALPDSKYTDGKSYYLKDGKPTKTSAMNILYSNTDSGLEAHNVQGAIDEVASDVSTLNERFALIEGKIGSVTDSTIADFQFDYPNGFNSNNCVEVSTMFYSSGWRKMGDGSANSAFRRNFVTLASSKVVLSTNDVGMANKDVKIMLMKI